MSGLFITFEGGEGGGKTTQLKLLADYLREKGHCVVTTREPGGTPAAEDIRKLVVEGEPDRFDAVSETLLFLAARRSHWQKLIEPALARGDIVICDRFIDSTVVYQGISKGLGVEYVTQLTRLALGPISPSLTLLLDIPAEAGLARAHARSGGETRFEALGLDFHTRVREGFLKLAQAEPGRIKVIPADQAVDVVQLQIRQFLSL